MQQGGWAAFLNVCQNQGVFGKYFSFQRVNSSEDSVENILVTATCILSVTSILDFTPTLTCVYIHIHIYMLSKCIE